MIALVPAKRWLYGTLDERLGHYRRYEDDELRRKVEDAGFEIETMTSMNTLGMIGWFASARIFKRQTIPAGQVRLFERLVPLVRVIDRWTTPLIGGLSLICVARRPSGLPRNP